MKKFEEKYTCPPFGRIARNFRRSSKTISYCRIDPLQTSNIHYVLHTSILNCWKNNHTRRINIQHKQPLRTSTIIRQHFRNFRISNIHTTEKHFETSTPRTEHGCPPVLPFDVQFERTYFRVIVSDPRIKCDVTRLCVISLRFLRNLVNLRVGASWLVANSWWEPHGSWNIHA